MESALTKGTVSRVLVLYTGGTIGMKPSEGGSLRPAKGFLAHQLLLLPAFNDSSLNQPYTTPVSRFGKRVHYDIKEWDELLDSSNMRFEDWVRMINDIEQNYEKYDAFVIIHGTDTLAYTASGLSFLIENLGKTIIITGSQLPLAMEPNDAQHNLLSSITIAGHFEIPEVCVFFNNKLMRGNRTRKWDAVGFDAFISPNFPELVKVGSDIEVNWNLVLEPPLDRQCIFHRNLSSNVGVLKLFPGISATTVRNFLQPPLQGCVLETYGAGNAPDNRPELLAELRQASDRGVVITNVTQCWKGTVNADTYATGVALRDAGVVSGLDTTTEGALAKLAYLLARKDCAVGRVRKLMGQSLRGELTAPVSQLKFTFRDSQFINLVARSLLSRDISQDANTAQELRGALFPVLLCSAASAGYIQEIESLLKSGADVNASDYDKRTPLHVASADGQLSVVHYLVGHGGQVNARDRWGGTPLSEAIRGKHAEIEQYLRAKGAVESSLNDSAASPDALRRKHTLPRLSDQPQGAL